MMHVRIYELGEGVPEVAVIGAIHGDEPCGKDAVERLVEADIAVERPVKLIIANEQAIKAEQRYVDNDLNRAFPGSPESDSHENRLAHDLLREVRGKTVLSLHSTQSSAEPFALVEEVDAVSRAVCPHLPIKKLVETKRFSDGRLIEQAHTIEVECGLQQSDSARKNAYWITRAFLSATGVLSAPIEGDVFQMLNQIPKKPANSYEVFVDNFQQVNTGDLFARADEDRYTADQSFFPILLSAHGYEDVFGYAADRVGTLR